MFGNKRYTVMVNHRNEVLNAFHSVMKDYTALKFVLERFKLVPSEEHAKLLYQELIKDENFKMEESTFLRMYWNNYEKTYKK